MTTETFQRLLKEVNPRLRVRKRPGKNVCGIFVGKSGKGGYICRFNEGELQLNGWSSLPMDGSPSRIQARGRKTMVNLLRNYRWIRNHRQRTMLSYGIEHKGQKAYRGKAIY